MSRTDVGPWRCGFTGETWTGDITNHHGLEYPHFCPGPHLREDHDILVWGPASEGDVTLSGKRIELPGWVWTCSCGASSLGHPSEADAEDGADRHLGREGDKRE